MILNLDELIKDDRKVIFDGREFLIPGDLPVRTMLELIKNSQEIQKDPNNLELTDNSMRALHKVLTMRQSYSWEEFARKITFKQYIKLVTFVCSVEQEAQEEKPDEKKSV